MKKVLPVFKTPISTYPHTANLASILWENKKIYPWLMNCFIKPVGWEYRNMDYEDFYILDCPAILFERMGRDLINKGWNNIISFIKDAIDSEYYLYLVVNTGEIEAYGYTPPNPHDMFIYGYDDEQKLVYIADCSPEQQFS